MRVLALIRVLKILQKLFLVFQFHGFLFFIITKNATILRIIRVLLKEHLQICTSVSLLIGFRINQLLSSKYEEYCSLQYFVTEEWSLYKTWCLF